MEEQVNNIEAIDSPAKQNLTPLQVMEKFFSLVMFANQRRTPRPSKHAQARTLRAIARQKHAKAKR
jgi:hypothetical protein